LLLGNCGNARQGLAIDPGAMREVASHENFRMIRDGQVWCDHDTACPIERGRQQLAAGLKAAMAT
jgi:hypothetical protein